MIEQAKDALFSQCNVVRSPIKAQGRYHRTMSTYIPFTIVILMVVAKG